jgi:hypothetical protein
LIDLFSYLNVIEDISPSNLINQSTKSPQQLIYELTVSVTKHIH